MPCVFEPQRFNPERCKHCRKSKAVHEDVASAAPPAGDDELSEEMPRLTIEDNPFLCKMNPAQKAFHAKLHGGVAVRKTKIDQPVKQVVRNGIHAVSLSGIDDTYKSPMLHSLQIKADVAEAKRRDDELHRKFLAKKTEEERRKAEAAREHEQELEAQRLKAAKEQRKAQEAAFADDAAVQKRITSGIPKHIAVGKTMPERMRLSHGDGQFVTLITHLGRDKHVWTCCGYHEEESWCLGLRAVLPMVSKDGQSQQAQLAAIKAEKALVKQRVAAGQPLVVAQGRTKRERMALSHTLNDCQGVDKCGKGKCGKCKCQWQEHAGKTIWSGCRGVRKDYWCLNYSGPTI